MTIPSVERFVNRQDKNWFAAKQKAFLSERLNDEKNPNRIYKKIPEHFGDVIIDIDFITYCWDSNFRYNNAELLDYTENDYSDLPDDSSYTANKIVQAVDEAISKYDAPYAEAIIKRVIENIEKCINRLKEDFDNELYRSVLDEFFGKTENELKREFEYIFEQVKIPIALDRKLTEQLCDQIADFKLDEGRFITSVDGEITRGKALFLILTAPVGTRAPIIRIEDWKNAQVYYLIVRLLGIFSNANSIAQITQPNKTAGISRLVLKNGPFSRNAYDTWKTRSYDLFKLKPDAKIIDEQLSTLR